MDDKLSRIVTDKSIDEWEKALKIIEFFQDKEDDFLAQNALDRVKNLLIWIDPDDPPEEDGEYYVTYEDGVGRRWADTCEYYVNEWLTEDLGKNVKIIAWRHMPDLCRD